MLSRFAIAAGRHFRASLPRRRGSRRMMARAFATCEVHQPAAPSDTSAWDAFPRPHGGDGKALQLRPVDATGAAPRCDNRRS
jgi:hypothetical protein